MRRSGLFWGVIILVLGLMLLLNNMGVFPAGLNVWNIFWPLLLVLVGVWFLLGPALNKRSLNEETLSIPLGNTTEAEVILQYEAGKLTLTSLNAPGQLLAGTFYGGVEHKLDDLGAGKVRVKVNTPHDLVMVMPFNVGPNGLSWNLGLTGEIPLSLKVESGAADMLLDLTNLRVTDLKVETGASSTRVQLPVKAGAMNASVKCGAASVVLVFPPEVAGRIRIESGLSGNKVSPRFVQTGNYYVSADYVTSTNRIDLSIEAGVGSIEIL
jgi:hypothetical protein